MNKKKIYKLNCKTPDIQWHKDHIGWEDCYIDVIGAAYGVDGYFKCLIYIDKEFTMLHPDHLDIVFISGLHIVEYHPKINPKIEDNSGYITRLNKLTETMKPLIDQSLDGLLYDLNLLPEQIHTYDEGILYTVIVNLYNKGENK